MSKRKRKGCLDKICCVETKRSITSFGARSDILLPYLEYLSWMGVYRDEMTNSWVPVVMYSHGRKYLKGN